MRVPLFIAEAITDVVVMGGFEGVPDKLLNPAVGRFIEAYGRNATAMFKQVNRTRDALFAPSCLLHTNFEVQRPLIRGVGLPAALMQWTAARREPGATGGGDFIWQDECDGRFWPPCNGHCPQPG